MPRLEHIGFAVRDADAAVLCFEKLLQVRPYKHESVPREGVRTHFISAGTAKLELLEALGPNSPIERFLERRGEGLHHLAFEVADIQNTLRRVREAGFTPLSDEPRMGADGKLIFFLHPKETHGVLVEFCQSVPLRLEAARVPFLDGQLAAYEFGNPNGTTVLLLHDVGRSTQVDMEPLIRLLETRFHVVALDFAAHGQSDRFPDSELSPAFLAESAVAVLDAFEIERASIFGHAVGGHVALEVAVRYPERVARLAVHAVGARWSTAISRAIVTHLQSADAVYPAHAGQQRASFDDRLEAFVRRLPELQPMSDLAPAIDLPVLVSTIDAHDFIPLADTISLYRAFPEGRLAVVPGTGHKLGAADAHVLSRLVADHFSGT